MNQECKTMQAQTPLFADNKKMQEFLAGEAKAGGGGGLVEERRQLPHQAAARYQQ
jgi:hypothetical protein